MDANEVAILIKARDEASKVMADVGKSAQSNLGAEIQKAATVGGAALVGMGAIAIKFGNDYDEATDKIAAATGKTGAELDALNDSMLKTFKSLPVSMGDAATAIGDLNARLGLTGKPLEDIAAKFLTLSRVTGTDLKQNVADITRVFGDWSIATSDQGLAMDKILKASQLTGVGINTLAQQVVQFGGPMRQLGFSFEETIALLGKFTKEGVNTELVMGSMRIALGKMAKDGEAPIETLNRVMDAIKNAGDAGEANALALELFGARAGPDMAAAIREGRFAIDDLVGQLDGAAGTIDQTAASTDDWREKLTLLKNNVIAAIAPHADLAGAILSVGGSVLLAASQAGPAFKAITSGVTMVRTAMTALGSVMATSIVALGGLAVAVGVAYAAYKLLNKGSDDATAAAERQVRVQQVLKDNTVEQIKAMRDQAAAQLEAAAAGDKSWTSMKNLAGLAGELRVYDEALGQIDQSAQDAARAHDGVTSAAEQMAGAVDEGGEALQHMAREAATTRGTLSDFDFVLVGVNNTLDGMTKKAGDAFSALDRFRSVPTQEQLDLNAAIAGNNLALFEAKQRLEEAKKAGDEMATAIETEHVKALEEEQSKLAESKTKLDLMRDATIEADKAKVGLSETVKGKLIPTEAELMPVIDNAAAAMSGQTSAADILREAADRVRNKFDEVVGLLRGSFIPAAHDSSVGVTELRDNFGEFTAQVFIQQANAAAAAAWAVAAAAETAAANISIMQQTAANPTVIPVVPPGPLTGPMPGNAAGTDYWRGGMTWVGERGPELVNLPRGSRIYSNEESMGLLNGPVSVNVYIDGRKYQGDMVRVAINEENARQRRAAALHGA